MSLKVISSLGLPCVHRCAPDTLVRSNPKGSPVSPLKTRCPVQVAGDRPGEVDPEALRHVVPHLEVCWPRVSSHPLILPQPLIQSDYWLRPSTQKILELDLGFFCGLS